MGHPRFAKAPGLISRKLLEKDWPFRTPTKVPAAFPECRIVVKYYNYLPSPTSSPPLPLPHFPRLPSQNPSARAPGPRQRAGPAGRAGAGGAAGGGLSGRRLERFQGGGAGGFARASDGSDPSWTRAEARHRRAAAAFLGAARFVSSFSFLLLRVPFFFFFFCFDGFEGTKGRRLILEVSYFATTPDYLFVFFCFRWENRLASICLVPFGGFAFKGKPLPMLRHGETTTDSMVSRSMPTTTPVGVFHHPELVFRRVFFCFPQEVYACPSSFPSAKPLLGWCHRFAWSEGTLRKMAMGCRTPPIPCAQWKWKASVTNSPSTVLWWTKIRRGR